MKQAKRWSIIVLGFVVLVAGIILIPAPGPGVLVLFVGMRILATQFEWAERRVDRVQEAALKGAADSVRTWPRIFISLFGCAWLLGLGVYWGVHPPAPGWWPLADKYWLIGGWGTGGTLIFSGLVALGLLIYSFVKLRGGDAPENREAAEPVRSSRIG